MKNLRKILLLIIGLLIPNRMHCKIDLTLVGHAIFAESLSGVTSSFMHALHGDLNINFIQTRESLLVDMPSEIIKIIKNSNKTPGEVAILTDIIWHLWADNSKFVPNSKIKLAYSMLESDRIPHQWVSILNSKFDAVVVPDVFCQNSYKLSGVTIPIFVLPCMLYLDDLFACKPKIEKNKKFRFVTTSLLAKHKNIELLINSFAKTFGDNPNVELVIHHRCNNQEYEQNLLSLLAQKKINNCKIIGKRFNRCEYIDFLRSADCYVLISMGEGFSITPREALALGVPCILSNNTAQSTICNSNFVYSVNALIAEPAYYGHLNGVFGNYYNCKEDDVIKALSAVYHNYSKYLDLAAQGRNWVRQYTYASLKPKYLNLIKPKEIILGTDNIVNDNYLMTDSLSLYNKYKSIK